MIDLENASILLAFDPGGRRGFRCWVARALATSADQERGGEG
jgi:hypothetical protein